MRNTALLVLFLASACFTGCRKAEDATRVHAAAPVAVTAAVVTVSSEPFHAMVPVTGTLISRARVEVKAEVIERVTRFDKEEGAHVEVGEAVAWVNGENYQLALRQAETGVKVAEAALERAKLAESRSRSELEPAGNLLKSGGITDKDLKAARVRLRPILMTTLAMIFGMLPLAFEIGSGAEFRAPMARAVIGGLITSTLLTLIVVPVVYTYLDDLGDRFERWWSHKTPDHAKAEIPVATRG
jgi:hypothetical protein